MSDSSSNGHQASSSSKDEEKAGGKGTWLDTLQMNPKMYWPKKYRYTIEPFPGSVPVLSVRERDHYEANGYIVIKNLLPKQTVQKYRNVFVEASPPAVEQTLAEFKKLPQILRYIECFCGPNIMAMHTQWINHSLAQMTQTSLHSPSAVEERIEDVPLHQNLFSLPFRPTDRILCLWAPLEQTSPKTTGGQSQQQTFQSFVLIPGSHRSSQLSTIDSDETLIYEPLPAAIDATTVRKQLSLNAGDVVLYHPLLSHGTLSSPSSTSSAGSISTFFASSDCQYIEYLHGRDDSLIPSHLKSISSMSVCPENRWKDYGVLVKGIRSSL